uniref:Lysine-specific demethylase n=1 Tax=Taeniopygia guttata TaxID=59729 RepID=A0A674HIJ8_TAEGU
MGGSQPPEFRGVPAGDAAPGLSHGAGSRGTGAAGGSAASPGRAPLEPLRLPIPFPRWLRGVTGTPKPSPGHRQAAGGCPAWQGCGETEAGARNAPHRRLAGMLWVTEAGRGPPFGVTPRLCSLPGVLRQERSRIPPLDQEPRGAAAAGQEPSGAGQRRGGGAGAARNPAGGWPGGGQLGGAPSPSPHASPRLQPPPVPPAARLGGLRGALGGLTAPRSPGLPKRPARLAPGVRGAQPLGSAGGWALPSGSGQTGAPPGLSPTLGTAGGRFPCPPSNHTKLKKTWLTRHSEQSLPRSKASRRDGGPETPGEGKRSAKRPHGTPDGLRSAGEGAGPAKRGTEAAACPGDGTEGAGLALGDRGELSAAGLCSLAEAEGDPPDGAGPEPGLRSVGSATVGSRTVGSRTVGSSLCLAKYLLGVLGDPFCAAVRRDRDAWPGAPGGPGGKREPGAPQLCDACQRGFFNSHWSCARCGFQLCPDCHRSGREESGPGMGTGRGGKGGVSQPWGLLHEVRAKFGIESHCPCGEGTAEQSPAEPPGGQVRRGGLWVLGKRGCGCTPTLHRARMDPPQSESPERGAPCPGQPPERGGPAQAATLRDLLASTAVKLCPGQDGVRMAFAPVAPALPGDDGLSSILDTIIARVVERKIQERPAGPGQSPPGSPQPPASPRTLTPSGLLWLRHPSDYKSFQEHWRQGQPVLVSGLQKKLEPRLWAPESFQRSGQEEEEEEEEVEAVNLRAPPSRVRISSREFWGGFAASAGEGTKNFGALLKLERGFGDTELSRVTNLRASLPLPEYCGASGRLNLATFLRGQRRLRPRLCAAYGESGAGLGGTGLWGALGLRGHPEPLLAADAAELEAPLRERLRGSGGRGALWHIFRAEDATRIRDFLLQVAAEPTGRYLEAELRRRLREERGVSGWSLLQLPGDAVLVPAGAPHQVRSLSGTISVEQQFLSPESAVRLRQLGTGAPPHLRAQVGVLGEIWGARGGLSGGLSPIFAPSQLDGMMLAAVREALEVLRGCQ